MADHAHEHDDAVTDLEKVKKAGAIAARARDLGASMVQEGRKLLEVAEEVEAFIRKEGAQPAFPVNLSIGTDAAHYTPTLDDPLTFQKGDLVKVDVGAHIDGHIGDTAMTVEVGTRVHERMILASREACNNAVALVKDGLPLTHVGKAIEETIRGHGFKPISNLTGHSIELYELHAGLSVPNVPRGHGVAKKDMVLAIEPFATDGAGHITEGKAGNIWHYLQTKPQRNPHARKILEFLEEKHPHLPWAERWLKGVVDDKWIKPSLRLLQQSACVQPYAVLKETGYVTQAEHTVIVKADGVDVTSPGALWPPKP
jgi:methionyl aminopeptidase